MQRCSHPIRTAVLTATVVLISQLGTARGASATDATVSLGGAESYSVLGGTGVTSTLATNLSGNLGVSPASSVVGFPPGVVSGQIHAGDPQSAGAEADLAVAYNDAAGRSPASSFTGDLNGRTFTPGVYATAAALALTGTFTLDGQGDPDAVFIFQVDAALNTSAASAVSLINGARASHVFWQVDGAAGLGASSSFSGTIMALGAITVGAGAVLTGRALSMGGTVTLSGNTIRTPPTVTIIGGSTAFTDDTTPSIAGTADAAAGTTITISVAGQTLTTTVAGTGTWTVGTAPVPAGAYLVTASVVGPAGNTGTARQTLTVGKTTAVALGSAATYSVLSGTSVSNTGATQLSDDLGVSPASTVVGFPPGMVGGETHAGDAPAALALADLQIAYRDAAGRPSPNAALAGDLNGLTLTPGVFSGAPGTALALTGTMTLDAQGDPNAVFIIQVDAALTVAAAGTVRLTDGAEASHVFWQVNGAAGLGAGASVAGTIMAAGAITVGAAATLAGRVLSVGGAIVLAANAVTTPPTPGGALSISVPSGPVSLGAYAIPVAGNTVSGPLGAVEVDDTRSGSSSAGWVVTVTATSFAPLSGPVIPPTSISYSAGPIIAIRGTATYTDDHPRDLSVALPAVTASDASGSNAAATAWNPTVSVTLPAGLVAGVYTSTITQSVL